MHVAERSSQSFGGVEGVDVAAKDVAIVANLHTIIDQNGCYTFVSRTADCFLGYNADEITGKKVSDFIHYDDRTLFDAALQKAAGGQTVTLPLIKLWCSDGKLKLVEASITNLSAQDSGGILVNYRDIDAVNQTDDVKNQVVSSHAAFFSKHPFGIFHMSVDGFIDRINPQLIKDLGYQLADIQKQPIISFVLPLYRRKVFLMFYNAINSLEPETFDIEVFKIDGTTLHVNFTLVPVVYQNSTLEIYGVVKDISDRFELQESLRRTSIVADRSLNGVVIMDSNRKIEWVNKGFTMMNGFTLEESRGHDPAYLLKVEGFSDELRDDVQVTLGLKKSIRQEIYCYKKDNTPYWNLVEITPVFNRNGKLERIISMHTDVTEKKIAEDQLKRFADDLYRQNKELHQFAYIVSHNLRSPVANVIGLATMMELYKDEPETLTEGLADLMKAANNMDNVIKDLSNILEISNSGSRGLIKEQVNVTELINQVKIDLKDVINNISAKIEPPACLCEIETNRAYLYSIFYNLISNAIKYRSASCPEINIACKSENNRIEFIVADNGIGIDLEKHHESIFKPYKRFNLDVEGKGLGLFLVKSHVEALSGTIEVKSKPGQGTVFTFILPL